MLELLVLKTSVLLLFLVAALSLQAAQNTGNSTAEVPRTGSSYGVGSQDEKSLQKGSADSAVMPRSRALRPARTSKSSCREWLAAS